MNHDRYERLQAMKSLLEQALGMNNELIQEERQKHPVLEEARVTLKRIVGPSLTQAMVHLDRVIDTYKFRRQMTEMEDAS